MTDKNENYDYGYILDTRIYKEYARYMTVKRIIKLDTSDIFPDIIEKMLLDMADQQHIKRIDPVFLQLNSNDAFYKNHLEPLKSLNYDDLSITILTHKIHIEITDFLNLNSYEPQLYSFTKIRNDSKFNTFTCGTYSENITYQRYKALKKVVPKKYKKYINKLILICLLRYESIVSRNYQSSMPYEWYEYLYYSKNVKLEGFASPFNSQLLLISDDTKYFSLFYDTDKYFNSMGNIFDTNISDVIEKYYNYNNIGCTFVTLDYRAFKKIIDVLLNLSINITFYMVFIDQNINNPLMVDIYENIKKYQKLLYYKKFSDNKKKWYLEHNNCGNQIIKFSWGKSLYIYVIGNNSDDVNNVTFGIIVKSNSDRFEKYNKKLLREYNRYLLIMEIIKYNNDSEWLNIIEKFVISMANINNKHKLDYIFHDLPQNHDVYKNLIRDIKQRNISNAKNNVKIIKEKIDNFLYDSNNKTINYIRIKDNNDIIYICNDYYQKISNDRHIILVNHLKSVNRDKYDIQLILILMIRYSCVMLGGNSWNIITDLYKIVDDNYGVSLEATTSPILSMAVMFNKGYASLFSDTDKYFGSYGKLYKLDIKKYINNNVYNILLYPPNIQLLVDNLIDNIHMWLKSISNIRVFICVSKKIIINSKYIKLMKEYTSMNDKGQTTILYILTNFNQVLNEKQYDEII